MAYEDNPLFHLEPVAVAALEKHYANQGPMPPHLPAHHEEALISYSIAISLKRIADRLEKGVVQL